MATTTVTNTPTTAATTTTSATAASKGTSSSLSSDYNSFLKLLTAQLRNQDPTKPVDATQFVAQLAQFSTVEQQVNTNTKLDNLLAAYKENSGSSLNTASTLALLGKVVSAPMSTVAYSSGNTVSFDYVSNSESQANVLQVKDASGVVVRSINLPLSVTGSKGEWNGLTDVGTVAPSGTYTFVLQQYKPNNVTEQGKVILSSLVTGANTDAAGVAMLTLANGDKVKATDITKVSDNTNSTLDAIAAYAKNISTTNDSLLNTLFANRGGA